MYYIYGISGPSLLIESTDSMISFEHAFPSNATDELYISHHGNENKQIVVSNLMR